MQKLKIIFTVVVLAIFVFAMVGLFSDVLVPPAPTPTGPPPVDLMEGAVLFEENYPPVKYYTWTVNGQDVTGIPQYPGLIELLVDHGTPRLTVWNLVSIVGGQLVYEIPRCGIYWLRVQENLEGEVIDQLFLENFVVDAYPLFPLALAQPTPTRVDVGFSAGRNSLIRGNIDSQIVVIDAFSRNHNPDIDVNGSDHGQVVSQISSACSSTASKTEVDVFVEPPGVPGQVVSEWIGPSIISAARGAYAQNRVTAINVSINAGYLLTAGNHRGASDPRAVLQEQNQFRFLERIFHQMEAMSDAQLDKVLVTISSGNHGLSLTDTLRDLRLRYPRAWDHVILAGGLDRNNRRNPNYNDSENPDDILYAQVPENLDGTSFTAPQFTCLAAAVAARRPDLTGAQIKRAIVEASPFINIYRVMPTVDAVVAKADELFRGATPTTTTPTTTTLGPGTSRYDGTYAATVTTKTPIGTTTGQGTFTVVNGRVSDPGGTFTGTVDANGNFTGTTIVSPGSPKMAMSGKFSLTGNFTLSGSSGNTSQTIVAHKT